MRFLKAGIICAVLALTCSAVVVHDTISYKSPIKKISGRVVGFGPVNPGVKVQVLDKPEVWSDHSINFDEKRKRQSTIASTATSASGHFEFRGLPKGSYEVEFSGREGWNPLSVFVVVDPHGSSQQLCVEMSIEGAGPKPSVQSCEH
jgi:hypothetical protein